MAPQVGFEPTTRRLTVACSTVELLRIENALDSLPCLSARAHRRRGDEGDSGCRTRIRTWARGSKVPCATATQSGSEESAEGRTRTDTGVAPQQFLRLPRLPFRHSGTPATTALVPMPCAAAQDRARTRTRNCSISASEERARAAIHRAVAREASRTRREG